MTRKVTVAVMIFLSVAMARAATEPLRAPIHEPNDPPADKSESVNIGRVGAWPYGPAYGVDVDTTRDLIFLGSGGVALILDGSDRTNPQLISEDIHTQGLVQDIFYDEATQRLFLACGEGGMEIWDVQNPLLPERLSVTEVTYFGHETPVGTIQVYNQFAIVECEWGYVHSLDVSDPANPVQVGFSGLMGNPASDIHISQQDGQVHSTGATRYQRLRILPGGQLQNSGYKDLGRGAVFGKVEVAYVGLGTRLFILDLFHPAFLPWSITEVGGIIDIVVDAKFAYFVNGSGFHIWDVMDHTNPFLVSSLPESYAYYTRLQVAEGYAYVADGLDGLTIIDIHDVNQPEVVGSYDVLSVTWETVIRGDHAYVAVDRDGLFILELGDHTRPEVVAQLDTPGDARDVALQGDFAYVADWSGGLRIVDVSVPESPAEVGTYEDVDAWRILVEDDLAYLIEGVPNQSDWLHILNVADPANPIPLGSLMMAGIVWELILSGDYLYVADFEQGVRIVDVSDPQSPVTAGWYPLSDVVDLFIEGDLLYVTAHDSWEGGFFILSIEDPENPTPVGQYNPDWFAPWHFHITGDYAYVSEGEDVHLLLISDPTNPQDLDEYRMPGDLFELTAREEIIYVSDGKAGLQILENLIYDDPGGGVLWQEQISGTSQHLNSVAFADQDRGWIVGDAGTILATMNGGMNWTPQSSGTGLNLTDLCMVSASTGWAVGSNGTILKTSDGGSQWLPQSSGTSVLLNGVDFVDTDTGWVIGDDGTILHTADGGSTWLHQASPTPWGLLSVSFVDNLHGWATVGDFGKIVHTWDGGLSWHERDTGSSSILLDIDFVNENIGWAVGMFGEIIMSTNGGFVWQQQQGVHPPDWLYSVYFIDENTGWNVGFDGKIQSTANGGDAWAAEPSGIHEQLHSVFFVDSHNGWVVGQNGVILRASSSSSSGEDPRGPVGEDTLAAYFTSYPNPFGQQTTIRFALSRAAEVQVDVLSVTGRHLRSLLHGSEVQGVKSIQWDGRDDSGRMMGSGTYVLRLRTGNQVQSWKVNLLR